MEAVGQTVEGRTHEEGSSHVLSKWLTLLWKEVGIKESVLYIMWKAEDQCMQRKDGIDITAVHNSGYQPHNQATPNLAGRLGEPPKWLSGTGLTSIIAHRDNIVRDTGAHLHQSGADRTTRPPLEKCIGDWHLLHLAQEACKYCQQV